MQVGLLLAESGAEKEALDLLSETELRYPGFIDQGVLQGAYQAARENRIEEATMLYNLAATITPQDEKIFLSAYGPDRTRTRRGIVDFYMEINRMDLAARMVAGLAPFQKREAMEQVLPVVLQGLLASGQGEEAYRMLKTMREQPTLQDYPSLWYYAGIVNWITGRTQESYLCLVQAYATGAASEALEPLFQAGGELVFFSLFTSL